MAQGGLEALVALFKRCLETGDAAPFLEATGDVAAGESVGREGLLAFVRAERARLGKLRTLGLTQGYEAKIALIDAVVARLADTAPGGPGGGPVRHEEDR